PVRLTTPRAPLCFLRLRRPPRSPLFPYTTLFRSGPGRRPRPERGGALEPRLLLVERAAGALRPGWDPEAGRGADLLAQRRREHAARSVGQPRARSARAGAVNYQSETRPSGPPGTWSFRRPSGWSPPSCAWHPRCRHSGLRPWHG